MVRLRAHRNESLGGLQRQYKTQDKNSLHSRNRSIFFGPEARTISTNRSPHAQCFEHASIHPPSIRSPSWELERKRVKGDQSFVRATAYERHFRCRAQADLAIFSFGTRSRSSSERACGIGDVRFVFVFCFCFSMFVYQVKTVPHIPLYMTSTYDSKTAVQYHMTPIDNITLRTVQYRTFTGLLL